MKDQIILRTSGDPVRMSFLLAVLIGEGFEADLKNGQTGVWRLTVQADQAEAARSALRNLRADAQVSFVAGDNG